MCCCAAVCHLSFASFPPSRRPTAARPGEAEESILIAAPVNATFQTTSSGGAGTVTHYILSAVPKDEIFEPVDGMVDLIQDSTAQVK